MPGIPMLFEGQEFLEDGSFRDDTALDWSKMETFKGINRLYRDLVHLRRNLSGTTKGLTGSGVKVLHVNDRDKIVTFHRWMEGGPKDDVFVIASFHHRKMNNYRLGFPRRGKWIIRFNSDSRIYSADFGDVGNPNGQVETNNQMHEQCDVSAGMDIPPYSLLILSQESDE